MRLGRNFAPKLQTRSKVAVMARPHIVYDFVAVVSDDDVAVVSDDDVAVVSDDDVAVVSDDDVAVVYFQMMMKCRRRKSRSRPSSWPRHHLSSEPSRRPRPRPGDDFISAGIRG
jgi:hypothetical protein